MKSSKKKLKESLHFKKTENFDKKFWSKFEAQNEEHKINWFIPMGLALSCFLVIYISFNTPVKTNLTYSDFESYMSMQFELDIEDELVAEVILDDDILFE